MSARQRVCTFFVAGNCYGIEVQEIIQAHPVTRVPRAPRVVRGLINLRGRIVTVLDLRRRLDLAERAVEEGSRNVVVRTAEGVVSLLVDEIGDILEVGPEAFEPAPETLQGVARELIGGAYKLPDRLLLMRDTDKITTLGAAHAAAPGPAEAQER
jgi:purine-binding chemotaxis protein CheW